MRKKKHSPLSLKRKISLRGTLAHDCMLSGRDVNEFIMEKWGQGQIERHEDGKQLLLMYYKRDKARVLNGEFA